MKRGFTQLLSGRPLLSLLSAGLIWLTAVVSVQANSGHPSGYGNTQVQIQEVMNLQTLAEQAKAQNLPIMFAIGAEWCEFCHVLKQEVLNPMALGNDYEGKYMYMRYFSIDDDNPIPGINGTPIEKGKWAEARDMDLTPTVVFIDGNGNEVAEKIIGISTLELYVTLIHQRLNQAYEKMGNPLRIPYE